MPSPPPAALPNPAPPSCPSPDQARRQALSTPTLVPGHAHTPKPTPLPTPKPTSSRQRGLGCALRAVPPGFTGQPTHLPMTGAALPTYFPIPVLMSEPNDVLPSLYSAFEPTRMPSPPPYCSRPASPRTSRCGCPRLHSPSGPPTRRHNSQRFCPRWCATSRPPTCLGADFRGAVSGAHGILDPRAHRVPGEFPVGDRPRRRRRLRFPATEGFPTLQSRWVHVPDLSPPRVPRTRPPRFPATEGFPTPQSRWVHVPDMSPPRVPRTRPPRFPATEGFHTK